MRSLGASLVVSVLFLGGCILYTEPIHDLESSVAAMVATKVTDHSTTSLLPSPTPQVVSTPIALANLEATVAAFVATTIAELQNTTQTPNPTPTLTPTLSLTDTPS